MVKWFDGGSVQSLQGRELDRLERGLSSLKRETDIITRMKQLVRKLSSGKISREEVTAESKELNILMGALANEEENAFSNISSAEDYLKEQQAKTRDEHKNTKLCTCGREVPTRQKFCEYCGYSFLKKH